MAEEIERKFLVTNDSWREAVDARKATDIDQGYLCADDRRSVRIRIRGEDATLTVKGETRGITRLEFTYDVPVADARELLQLCGSRRISKRRHILDTGGHVWEIDEFFDRNEGLVVAEIELGDENEAFDRPAWLGEDVSAKARYFNANLAQSPYCDWTE
jgi:adenylate cyclase